MPNKSKALKCDPDGLQEKLMKIVAQFCSIVFISMVLCVPASAEMYKWTDDHGVMHYRPEASSPLPPFYFD
jgi:hypothetical protein